MTTILGVDLGTNASAAAALVGGKVRLIASPDMRRTGKPFPSVVSFFDDGSCLIGVPASEQAVYNPRGTVSNVKREMGTWRKIDVLDRSVTPEFVSALLLMKMRVDAESFLNERITQAVVTIPANFNDAQRQATMTAGRIAGLNVVRLLQEPVAAAIAYGLHNLSEPSKILVFDMGAGTLDVSVLEADGGFFEVLATEGSSRVGGMDMTRAVADWISEHVRQRRGGGDSAPPPPPPDDQSRQALLETADRVKAELSESPAARFDVDAAHGTSVSVELTREVFDGLIGAVLAECRDVIMRALAGAGLAPADIDRVILVGGPGRIPAVRRMLAETVGEPERDVDPYFAVASGAAIHGSVLDDDPNLPVLYGGLVLSEVTPLDLAEEAQVDGDVVPVIMIPKNTHYPTSRTMTFFVNKLMQTEVKIGAWQGDFERSPGFVNAVSLGSFMLSGLRSMQQNEVEVTYGLDGSGMLTVDAAEIGTGNRQSLHVSRTWGRSGAAAELGYEGEGPEEPESGAEEMRAHEKRYRDVLSPYERPVDDWPVERPARGGGMAWMCGCLDDARGIILNHHAGTPPGFFDAARFELFLQDDMQYAYAYIELPGGPAYRIGIHRLFEEHTRENRRSLVITLVHELLHAVHPDWGHDRIRPEERRLANLAGYFDTYVEKERAFLSGRMAFCNNSGRVSGRRVLC